MFTIRNEKELKMAYMFVLLAEKLGDRNPGRLRDVKQGIRKYTARENDRRVIQEDRDGSGCIILIRLPKWIKTEEDAEEWFRYREYRAFVPGPYDCSGKMFTVWYKITERNSRFYAYHRIAIDC